jgi:hypothetical protein
MEQRAERMKLESLEARRLEGEGIGTPSSKLIAPR